MIQTPVTAFPAMGSAMPAQPVAREAEGDCGFGDWLDPAPPEGEVAQAEEGLDIGTEDDSETDPPLEMALVRLEVQPRVAMPTLGGAAGTAADGSAPEPDGTDLPNATALPAPGIGVAPARGVDAQVVADSLPVGDSLASDGGETGMEAVAEVAAEVAAQPAVPAGGAVHSGLALSPPAVSEVVSNTIPGRITHATPQVPRQVADAVVRMDGDVTEITLTPAELGTVRIAIARDSQGLLVTLTAERPEALDLLRRHVDVLRQELAIQGEEGARLDFSASGEGGGFAQAGRQDATARPAVSRARVDVAGQAEAMIRPMLLPGRIDMRI